MELDDTGSLRKLEVVTEQNEVEKILDLEKAFSLRQKRAKLVMPWRTGILRAVLLTRVVKGSMGSEKDEKKGVPSRLCICVCITFTTNVYNFCKKL